MLRRVPLRLSPKAHVMSQQSEECLPESASAEQNGAPGARILHMKGRHYDLQKAIQQRAQESVEREAALDHEQRRPKPLKWAIALLIAAIPIALTLTAAEAFLRVFHKYLDVTVQTANKQAEEQAAAAAAAAAAAEAQAPVTSDEPGVVMLSPLLVPPDQKAQQAAPSQTSQAADPKK
ncbi:hypothetical protein GCM10011487_30180 [Steroidobacter agaridevorans]|uniref:Uncharacterized protein n=2 Tax=Steroidobacter agaridevorans TaxID=2695856 RepID=A0A829YDU7_9GAMM|nr:hypothetical protein GCM10011487_30180 [Steroidobacter agaridevorans]GFE89098.1 hypothetical protein GCM10011488_40520 [Steroidobacter agaridevorans]